MTADSSVAINPGGYAKINVDLSELQQNQKGVVHISVRNRTGSEIALGNSDDHPRGAVLIFTEKITEVLMRHIDACSNCSLLITSLLTFVIFDSVIGQTIGDSTSPRISLAEASAVLGCGFGKSPSERQIVIPSDKYCLVMGKDHEIVGPILDIGVVPCVCVT